MDQKKRIEGYLIALIEIAKFDCLCAYYLQQKGCPSCVAKEAVKLIDPVKKDPTVN